MDRYSRAKGREDKKVKFVAAEKLLSLSVHTDTEPTTSNDYDEAVGNMCKFTKQGPLEPCTSPKKEEESEMMIKIENRISKVDR